MRWLFSLLPILALVGYVGWSNWTIDIDADSDTDCAAITSAYALIGSEIESVEAAGVAAGISRFYREQSGIDGNAAQRADIDPANARFTEVRNAVLERYDPYANLFSYCAERAMNDPAFKRFTTDARDSARDEFEASRARLEAMRQQIEQSRADDLTSGGAQP